MATTTKINYLNHGCDNNVFALLGDESTLMIYANCKIRKGEELLISYGNFDFYTARQPMRSLYIKQNFGFTCKCNSCFEGYPSVMEVPEIMKPGASYCFPCDLDMENSKSKEVCDECKNKIDSSSQIRLFNRFMRHLQNITDENAEDLLPDLKLNVNEAQDIFPRWAFRYFKSNFMSAIESAHEKITYEIDAQQERKTKEISYDIRHRVLDEMPYRYKEELINYLEHNA